MIENAGQPVSLYAQINLVRETCSKMAAGFRSSLSDAKILVSYSPPGTCPGFQGNEGWPVSGGLADRGVRTRRNAWGDIEQPPHSRSTPQIILP